MAVVQLDIYPADDPNGTPLVTLTDEDVAKFSLRVGENELGGGEFTIRRDHPDATVANLAAGNYVKVTFPVIDSEPVWAFWLDEHDDTILSREEEGGEFLTRKGFGPLWVLRHANLLNDIHVPAQVNRGNRDEPGYWTWVGEPYGAILQRVLEEGRLQPGTPLVEVTDDFTRAVDSDANAWSSTTTKVQLPIGTDGLTAYRTLVESGELFVRPTPDLLIQAYKFRGRDLTGAAFGAGVVRFVKGVNIDTELTRTGHGNIAATHALVEGSDHTYRQVVSPEYVAPPGRWATVQYDESDDTGLLDKVGTRSLAHRNEAGEAITFQLKAAHDQANGLYLPWVHFIPGDLVTLHTGTDPWDYNERGIRLVGFDIELGETTADSDPAGPNDYLAARSLEIAIHLGQGSTTGGLGGGSGGKCCPSLKLCHDYRDTIFDTFNRTVAAGGWGDSTPTDVPWEWTAGGTVSVDGTHGVMVVPVSTSVRMTANDASTETVPWFESGAASQPAYTMRIAFQVNVVPGAGDSPLEFTPNIGGVGTPFDIRISTVSGAIETADETVAKTDWVANTEYVIEVEYAGPSAVGEFRVRVLTAGVPSAWAHGAGVETTNGELELNATINGAVGSTITVRWNYVELDGPTCIHGGPGATSGESTKAAPGDHEHDYVAAGGTTGQVLAKATDSDWDTEWVAAGGGGAPDDATYLVTTAHGDLSAEVVVGATPGGELGGTWASPTVDASHGGGTHAATQTAAEATAAAALAGHTGDTTDAHDASAISIADAGAYYTGTDVEAALQEIGAGGIGGGGGITLVPETPVGTIDGVNDDFTLSVVPDLLILFKNGLLQREGSGNDYTLSGLTITYEAGNLPQTGDSHRAYINDSVTGEILDHTTAETDTSLRLAPDGAGGVEWAAGAGGGGSTSYDLFGDGQDGNVTINSGTFSVSVGGSALITNNVLQRDAYFDNLTLNGGDLITNGSRIFVKTALTLTSGVIRRNGVVGSNGGNGTAGAGGSAGAGGVSPLAGGIGVNLINGLAGGVGGFNAAGGAPTAGGGITAGRTAQPNGSTGGASGQGQAGGTAGTTTATLNTLSDRSPWTNFVHSISFRIWGATVPTLANYLGQALGGSGGGGAASSGGGGGGGGGSSGGIVILAAATVTGTTDIQALGGAGGNGGNGGGTDAGGGAGGNGGSGGWIVFAYRDKTGWSGTLDVSGGAGGTGGALIGTGSAGGNGSAGNDGIVREWPL